MFKLGGFYLTARGQLVKIFNEFKFADGYSLNAAIYTPSNNGWIAVRYTPDGRCNVDGDANKILAADTFTSYHRYLQFLVWFDRATNMWKGRATDLRGTVIVDLANVENHERAMHLIQVGAEQKLLTWMREAGYDEEVKETI